MQKAFEFGASADLQWIYRTLPAPAEILIEKDEKYITHQFVLSLIGSRTRDETSQEALKRLLERFQTIDGIANAPVHEIEALIQDVNFPDKKAWMLKAALETILARIGGFDLSFLGRMSAEDAHAWLESIKGVGPKIAAATLNFSALRMRTFVVDTHVLRVLRRFGLVDPKAQTLEAYRAVMEAGEGFDTEGLFTLHWQLKHLGQQICRHGHTACGECPLSPRCKKRFGDAGVRPNLSSMLIKSDR